MFDSIITFVASYWDKLLSILGGIFGGIPTIYKWISKPRLYINDFQIQKPTTIDFTIANWKVISRDITELEIKCFVQSKEKTIYGLFTLPEKPSRSLALQFAKGKENNFQTMYLQALPCGKNTETLRFFCMDELPNEFEFNINMTFKEGRATLRKKHKQD